MERGEVWWIRDETQLGPQSGGRRPVLVVQADSFNRSRIGTVLALSLSSRMRLLDAPGNVLLSKKVTGLPRDATAVMTRVQEVSRELFLDRAGRLPPPIMKEVERGLRLVLDL